MVYFSSWRRIAPEQKVEGEAAGWAEGKAEGEAGGQAEGEAKGMTEEKG